MKRFLIIGSQGISSEQIMALYELGIEECVLADGLDPNTWIGHGRLMILTERPKNDYKEYFRDRITEHFEFYGPDGGIKIRKTGRKVKFKTEVEWYKKLKRKGKG